MQFSSLETNIISHAYSLSENTWEKRPNKFNMQMLFSIFFLDVDLPRTAVMISGVLKADISLYL